MTDRALAERLARLAGGIAMDLRGGAVRSKAGATDVVTEADERAEAALLALLERERPDDGVLGEEGASVGGGERRWLLDPVDGTLNFARGLPAWCSAVVLVDAAGPLACGVFDPVADTLFSAARGAGATCNGAPLRVDPAAPPLGDALIATFIDARRRGADVVAQTEAVLRSLGALRAYGCGTLELAAVAAGRLHGWVQADVEPWDWNPGALLVAEAGGVVDVAGRWHVAAADAALAGELRALVTI